MTRYVMTVLLAAIIGFAAPPMSAWGGTWYVDAGQTQTTPAPDGSSWSLALPFLEDAIQAAISDTNTTDIDFIVVAQGVYHPGDTTTSPNNTDQSKSFVLQPRMRIGGGFRGIAGLPSNANDRDPSTYVTILSGDLDDDDVDSHVDGLHQAARNENSFLVVQVSDFSTPVDDVAELDGLVIRDGQSSYSWLGAGIFVPTDCNPNIRNCVIKKNRIINNGLGSDGAGIYVEMNASLFNLTILIEDTVIEDNESGAGGGIALSNYSKARLTGCTVRHNKATGVGGGGLMAHDFALFTLLDCDVSENTAISEYGPAGGGVRIVKDAELYMKNSTVRLNEAIDTGAFVCGGGGIYVAGRSRADIVSTTIEGNSASGLGVVDGGGVYVDTDEENMPASRLINTMIHDNDATTSHEETFSQGGGIFVGTAGKLHSTNCLIHSNMADKGGGVCIDLASSPTFVGCTVADNVANVLTGGIYSLGSSSPTTLVNCILWQNVDDASSVLDAQLSVDSGSAIVATYSCIADGTQSSTPYSGTGNIDLDPIFFEPAAHNYRLHRCSPALDAADSDPIPDDDENADDDAFTNELTPELDNKLRDIDLPIVDTGNGTPDFVDMGAYEKECFCDELGDMNGDTERDGLDIQPFVDCFLNQRSEQACHCECGDYVFPGGVGIEDVAEFVNCLLDKSETCGQPACEIEGLPRAGLSDCNSNGQTDETDIVTGYSADCNGNGIPDECDIASETSDDDDADGTPDECEPDCNSNGIPDDHDIATETSEDCNANDVPDECDFDCNDNDIPDDCEELEADCNENGIPDACEYDCDENGVPDDCDLDPLDPDGDEWVDPDCNENGWPDSCDIDEGPPFGSLDANENEIPDECEEEESLMGGGEGGGESMMSGGGSSGGESSSESQSSGGSSPSPQPSPFEGEGAGCDASYWPADYSVMSNEMYAAWEAFMLWCMQERWGPDSAYTGAEQLERLIEKKVEVGICEDELNEQ